MPTVLSELLRCGYVAAACLCILLSACSSSPVTPVDGDAVADGDGFEREEIADFEEPGETDLEPDMDLDLDEESSEQMPDSVDEEENMDGADSDPADVEENEDPEDCLLGQRVTISLPPDVRPQQCSPNEGMVHWVSVPAIFSWHPHIMHGSDSLWCSFSIGGLLWCKKDEAPLGSIAQFVPPRGMDSILRYVAVMPNSVVYVLTDGGRLYRWVFPGEAVDVTETLQIPTTSEDNPWVGLATDRAVSMEYPVLIQRGGLWIYREEEWQYQSFPEGCSYTYYNNVSHENQVILTTCSSEAMQEYFVWDEVSETYKTMVTVPANNTVTAYQFPNILDSGLELIELDMEQWKPWVVVYDGKGDVVSRTPLVLEGSREGVPLWFYGIHYNPNSGEPIRRYALKGMDNYVWYNDGNGWRARQFPPGLELSTEYWSFSIAPNGSLYISNSARVYAFSLDNQWSLRLPELSLDSDTDVWVSPDSSTWIASSGYPVMRLADGCTLETLSCRALGRKSMLVKSSISGWKSDDVIVSAQEEKWVWRLQDGQWRHFLQPEFWAFPSELAAGAPGYATVFTDYERMLIYTWSETGTDRYLAGEATMGGSGPLGSVMRGSDQAFFHDVLNSQDANGLVLSHGEITGLTQMIPGHEVWDIIKHGDEVLVFDGMVLYRLDEDLNLIDPPWHIAEESVLGRSVAMGDHGPELLLSYGGSLWFLTPGSDPENMYMRFPGARFIRKLAEYEYIIWGPDGTVVRFVLPFDYRE